MQRVLYRTFLVSCCAATILALLLVWCVVESSALTFQCLATCTIVAVATAFTMSATRLVSGRAPEDDRG